MECMVELANSNKEVIVIAKSHSQYGVNVFSKVIRCVMEAKAEFCHCISPQFFLFDSAKYSEAESLNSDNLFDMHEVERALIHPEENNVILSVSGKAQMERSTLVCMRAFTLWDSLFPLSFDNILDCIRDIVKELYLPQHLTGHP